MLSNSQKFLNLQKITLSLVGLWPLPSSGIIYKIYKIFIMFSQYILLIFNGTYMVIVWGDIDAMSQTSYFLFTQTTLCCKASAFVYNNVNIRNILDFMDSEVFKPQNDDEKRIIKKHSTVIRTMYKILFFFTMSTIAQWAVMPLIEDNGRTFAYNEIWMPVNVARSPDYEIAFVVQLLAIIISGSIFMSVDTVTAAVIMSACAQLDIIVERTKKFIPYSNPMKTKEKLELMRKNYALLISIIKHHQAVNAFMELVENTFHVHVFFQLCDTVFIISVISYCTADEPPNTVHFYSSINYLSIMLGQLYLYCWCGGELTSRSKDIQDWLYQMPWYEQNLKFHKTLVTAIECVKKPIVFKAGHYIPLSRATFVSILRCSYSYFAVLRRAHDEN